MYMYAPWCTSARSYNIKTTMGMPNISVIYTIILLKSVCLSVGVRKLQVVILARSSREMYLTVRIVWQYILSRVRVSVRPSISFIWEKPRGNLAASASVYFKGQRPAIVTSGAGRDSRAVTVDWHRITIRRRRCVYGGLCTRSRGCVRTCVCVRPFVRACVMCLQYTIIIFDPGW